MRRVLKSMDTEDAFTKVLNETFICLKNTRCVEKVSRLKLYLPRHRMKHFSWHFKKVCWTVIQTEAPFTKAWRKRCLNFKKYVYWIGLEAEAVFTKKLNEIFFLTF